LVIQQVKLDLGKWLGHGATSAASGCGIFARRGACKQRLEKIHYRAGATHETHKKNDKLVSANAKYNAFKK
jgi:hypothetical protein